MGVEKPSSIESWDKSWQVTVELMSCYEAPERKFLFSLKASQSSKFQGDAQSSTWNVWISGHCIWRDGKNLMENLKTLEIGQAFEVQEVASNIDAVFLSVWASEAQFFHGLWDLWQLQLVWMSWTQGTLRLNATRQNIYTQKKKTWKNAAVVPFQEVLFPAEALAAQLTYAMCITSEFTWYWPHTLWDLHIYTHIGVVLLVSIDIYSTVFPDMECLG